MKAAAAAKSRPNKLGDLGDKAAAASRPFRDFGDQQPSHWKASSYLGKNEASQ